MRDKFLKENPDQQIYTFADRLVFGKKLNYVDTVITSQFIDQDTDKPKVFHDKKPKIKVDKYGHPMNKEISDTLFNPDHEFNDIVIINERNDWYSRMKRDPDLVRKWKHPTWPVSDFLWDNLESWKTNEYSRRREPLGLSEGYHVTKKQDPRTETFDKYKNFLYYGLQRNAIRFRTFFFHWINYHPSHQKEIKKNFTEKEKWISQYQKEIEEIETENVPTFDAAAHKKEFDEAEAKKHAHRDRNLAMKEEVVPEATVREPPKKIWEDTTKLSVDKHLTTNYRYTLMKEIDSIKTKYDNKNDLLSNERFLKEMVEKWELNELETDLKFNLPLDLNTQYFYAFQKFKYKTWKDPGLWKRDLNVETEQVLFNTDGVLSGDTPKNVLKGMGIDLSSRNRNLSTLSDKSKKLQESLKEELLDKKRILGQWMPAEAQVDQNTSTLDQRNTLDYALNKRYQRIYNSGHMTNHRIFDSFNRFMVDSSFPMYAKQQATIEDEVHVKLNPEYVQPQANQGGRRDRLLEETKQNERILLGDHDHEESTEDSANTDHYKLLPVDKSLYTKNRVIKGLIEVGTFGETAICRCPDGSMYYVGKYDWTFFPELYACEGGVIEGYHRFTDFEGQGIKVICGQLKTMQETCSEFPMASCECGQVTYQNALGENKTKSLYCPKHYTCKREELEDNNGNKTKAPSGVCVKKAGDSSLEDKYKSKWKFHDHDGQTTIHMHKFDEIDGEPKFETDENGMEKKVGPHVHIPPAAPAQGGESVPNAAPAVDTQTYELPPVCANACEFVRLDDKKCGRYVDTDYYCKNPNQECIREQVQVIMWSRDQLPILMDKFNTREKNNQAKNDHIREIEALETQIKNIEGAGKELAKVKTKLENMELGDTGLMTLRAAYTAASGDAKVTNRRKQIEILEKYIKTQFLHCRYGNDRLQLLKQVRQKNEELTDFKLLTQDGAEKPVVKDDNYQDVAYDAYGGWIYMQSAGQKVYDANGDKVMYQPQTGDPIPVEKHST
jgi:predicted metal-dependent hydrolase